MNKDRRQLAQVCIELLKECHEIGEISDQSHTTLTEAVAHLRAQEVWQLKAQSKWEGNNASTDAQIAICRVSIPALEKATEALAADDFSEVITLLETALKTDGTAPAKATRKARA